MKSLRFRILSIALVMLTVSLSVNAQEEESSAWSTGFDVYSSYIWRGAKFGTGPALQPYVDATVGGLSIGAWGSVNAGSEEALEMDLYLGYAFDFGLGITVTDYYFGGDWAEFDVNHFIEPMLTYEVGDLGFTFAHMLTPEFEAGDTYIEVAYSLGAIDLSAGLGDGAYSVDGDFALCNLTLGTSKEIAITESFSLPVSGSVTLNPSTGGFFIAAGVSF